MKFSKFTKAFALAMALTMLLSISAFADSQRPYFFDFEQTVVNLAPGDVYTMRVRVYDDVEKTFSCYIRGNESKNTYVWSDFNVGWTTVDIHIGKDETSKGLTIYFYIDGTNTFDNIQVRIVDPANSYLLETRKNAEKIRKENAEYIENQKLLAIYYAKLEEKKLKEENEALAAYYKALEKKNKANQ
ncbi:MAG: hypothetical protein MJZ11_02870 [Lachnospiraceae bacterium]|nr:hypothetical protein [Lachnospiraceae bacterium]